MSLSSKSWDRTLASQKKNFRYLQGIKLIKLCVETAELKNGDLFRYVFHMHSWWLKIYKRLHVSLQGWSVFVVVSRYTIEMESAASSTTATQAVWIKCFVDNIKIGIWKSYRCICDNNHTNEQRRNTFKLPLYWR